MITVHEIDTTISGTRAREKAYRALAIELERALKREPNAAAPGECCCAAHHPNYGRCLQCPIHGTLPPGASDD